VHPQVFLVWDELDRVCVRSSNAHRNLPRGGSSVVPQASQPGDDDPAGLGKIQAPVPQAVSITRPAAVRIKKMLAGEDRTSVWLRVAVQPTAGNGPRYQLFFDDRRSDSDTFIWFDGDSPTAAALAPQRNSSCDRSFGLVIARRSLRYLAGATIHYANGLQRGGFTIDSPRAKSSCGCGWPHDGSGMAGTNQLSPWMDGLAELGTGGDELEVPMAWLCAEQTAEHLMTCVDAAMLPDTFEFRAACNVLTLTLLLSGLCYRAASLPTRQAISIGDLISAGELWLGWCDSQLSAPSAVATADLRLARSAWRWLVQGRLLLAPDEAELDDAHAAWTRPGAGCRIGLRQARRIIDTCLASG
jgi:Fe-S cluster assembly iron-binding protein IscA